METCDCPLGCSPGERHVIEGFDRLHGSPGKWHVVECTTCGLRRTNPRPEPSAIGSHYPTNYGPFHVGASAGGARRSDFRGSLARVLREHIEFNDKIVPDMKPGRLLEVGCATGDFLEKMSQKGWDVTGIEPSEFAANHARAQGFNVHSGSLEAAPPPPDEYDLVVGWMVLEHLHQPVAALRRLHEWTRPTARLAISVPDASGAEARLFGDAWYALQLPTHLFHYTPDSVCQVLEAGGWQVTRIVHQRTISNAAVSLGYRIADRWPDSRLARALLDFPNRGSLHYLTFPLAAVLARVGQTGRMTIWAERTPTPEPGSTVELRC